MNQNVLKVQRSTSLRALLVMFKGFRTLPLIPVVNEGNCLIGAVYPENLLDILRPSRSKLVRRLPFVDLVAADKEVFDLEPAEAMGELIIVDDIMEAQLISISANTSLEEAYRMMRLHKSKQLPVVGDNNALLGTIGIFDIIIAMFKEKGIIE